METRVVQNGAEPSLRRVAPSHAIETDSLSKSFEGVDALRDLRLSVPTHSIFGFLGPNGAGKTTTIKLLLGLSRPTGGGARVFGLDIAKDSLAIRQQIGYLAQEPRYYDHMTARETLQFTGRFFYRGQQRAVNDRIEEALALVGLEDRADRPIKGFSGGERQRLGLAQAQMNHPALLILDEPAASLDPVGRRDVLDVMLRLKAHATVFYSTHILDDVQRVSDHVAILDKGRLITQAPTSELLDGGGTRYHVTVLGDGSATAAMIDQIPWVTQVTVETQSDKTSLMLTVTDEVAAENELLARFIAIGATVSDFGRRTMDLEEVFLGLVERNDR